MNYIIQKYNLKKINYLHKLISEILTSSFGNNNMFELFSPR